MDMVADANHDCAKECTNTTTQCQLKTKAKDKFKGLPNANNYVDDNRSFTRIFRPGVRFNRERMKYIWTKEDEDEDVANNICLVELTQREILKYLNSMTSYLRFTMEYFTDYEDGYLPTLDFKTGIGDEDLPIFRFYEKPMKTNCVTPLDSATSLYNKITWTSNDLARRLLRTEEDSINEELPKIVNQYDYKLMWS